jgi:hypothetical protein
MVIVRDSCRPATFLRLECAFRYWAGHTKERKGVDALPAPGVRDNSAAIRDKRAIKPSRNLCRSLCHNPAIPTRVGPCRAVSLGSTRKTANERKTRMNTVFLYRSVSLLICLCLFALGNGMEEVVGSIPTRSTNKPNNLANRSRKTRFRYVGSHAAPSAALSTTFLERSRRTSTTRLCASRLAEVRAFV